MEILLVEDDDAIALPLVRGLEREGFGVQRVVTGGEALAAADFDLVLLDLGLPDMNGIAVCHELRARGDVPIIVVSARGEEADRVVGLELGADDYIVKPFSFRELLARIRANLRRVTLSAGAPNPEASDPIAIGTIAIDRKRHSVSRNGLSISLSQREYDLLLAMLNADGAVVARTDLLDTVWGEQWIGDPRTLDVHIRWLREKLEDEPSHPCLILTVRGVGYRLVTPDELDVRSDRS